LFVNLLFIKAIYPFHFLPFSVSYIAELIFGDEPFSINPYKWGLLNFIVPATFTVPKHQQ